jgi:hypothetical protein
MPNQVAHIIPKVESHYYVYVIAAFPAHRQCKQEFIMRTGWETNPCRMTGSSEVRRIGAEFRRIHGKVRGLASLPAVARFLTMRGLVSLRRIRQTLPNKQRRILTLWLTG